MKQILTIIGLLYTSFTLSAQCDGFVEFTDTNLETGLVNHGKTITGNGISIIDTDGDGRICKTEAEAYTGKIKLKGLNIVNLDGLDQFSNISNLSVAENNISTLDLSSFKDLSVLNCNGNNLTTLNVNLNPKLTILFADFNELTSLDLSNNPSLERLKCSNNKLTELNASNLSLTEVACTDNMLTQLNVTGNTDLKTLDCNNNMIVSLDVSNLSLTRLDCSSNALSSLNVSGNSVLNYLDFSDNKLTSIDLSTLPMLDRVVAKENMLSEIDLANNPALTYINANNNMLSTIDASNHPNLVIYCFEYNMVTDATFSDNSAIQRIGARGNKLTTLNLSTLPNLNNVRVDDNNLKSLIISNGNNENLVTFTATNNSDLSCIQIDPDFETTTQSWEIDTNADYSDACLQLEIVDYSARASDKDVLLSWASLNENGQVDYFNIYRSSTLNPTYVKIGQTPSSFMSLRGDVFRTTNIDYTYTDPNIIDTEGILTYKVEAVGTNGSTQSFENVEVQTSFPISLSSFDVKKDNNDAFITWSTDLEINNSHFNIQRSTNGIHFETVGTVNGKGNSTEQQTYTFTDVNVGTFTRDVYYRLEQVDFDGTSSIFKTASITFSTKKTTNTFPNPVMIGEHLTITAKQINSVAIYNMFGVKVSEQSFHNVQKTTVNTDGFTKGIYLVIINNDSQHKVIVQ